MSASAKSEHTFERHFETIVAVAHEVASCSDSGLPHLLLQLYPIVSLSGLSPNETLKIKEHIWLNDLLHALVEALRQDFSGAPTGWNTATQLSFILESVCSSLHPKESQERTSREVREYYDILLPTAVDSLLILASNVLQAITENIFKSSKVFENVFHSILSICASHNYCVHRVIESPYLHHMLFTDDTTLACVVLTALGILLKRSKNYPIEFSPEILYSIFDILVYKMSGPEKKIAYLSLEIMAVFSSVTASVVELIVYRYTELMSIVKKWKFEHLGADVKHFIQKIELKFKVESEDVLENNAATIIQASWRGYCARRKLARLRRGIRRFQQIYRRWKTNKETLLEKDNKAKVMNSVKLISACHGRQSFLEGQLALIQQLPPEDVTSFIEQQRIKAAIKIQSQWRTYLAERQFSQLRQGKTLSKCAIIIQRAFREFKKRKLLHTHVFPIVGPQGDEREQLQQEITLFRERKEIFHKSISDRIKLHTQAQDLLEQFYLSRPTESRKAEQREIILSQLQKSHNVLASAPALSESLGMEDIINTFSSSSESIMRMAQTAHEEELKCSNTPWWKEQTPMPVDDDY